MKHFFARPFVLAITISLLIASITAVGLIIARPEKAKNVTMAEAVATPVKLAPPEIEWVTAPNANERGRIAMAFHINASAPLLNLQIQITPIVKMPDVKIDRDLRDIPTWLLGQKKINWEGEMDLTASPLAGSPVMIEILAVDEDKRSAVSDVASITLPERIFTSPIAKSVYAVRKDLRANPEKRNDALRVLARFLQSRENFEDNKLGLLTLRSATVRIALDGSDDGLNSALDLLWHAAVLFEQDHVRVADKVTPIKKN